MSGAMSPLDPSSPTERRYALIVGVDSAPNMAHLSSLKGAEENARAVAKVLQKHGDWTLLCEPLLGAAATTGAVRHALNTLAQKRTDHDLLLFYFAGHGSIHEDHAGQRPVFLVTSDFDASLIEEDEATDSISLGFLQERLYEKTKAGRVVVLLDCCYAGNAGSTTYDIPLDTISNLFKYYLGASNKAASGKYRITLAATAHDVEASEKDNHSMTKPLLAALRGECVDALNQNNGQMTVERLYDYLRSVMPDEQKPSLSGNTEGRSIILATYPEHTAQARQTQQRASQLYERHERLQILSAAPDRERFLRDRLESFVGRKKELHDIQQRIVAVQPSGGYVTVTGQAGQGKSSVIAALIAQYATTTEERKQIPFHFIPFNPGPEYQVTLLRNIMARLILKYNLSDLYVASESRPALCDFFPKVLSDVAAKGGQEIIFIDGLDQIESELNGVRNLSFLPTNPPEGIVLVLGTRPDDTLKPLTLLKPTQSYLLPPLSRDDFSTLLQRRQVPPLEQRLADQFYEKMQQNALYLDLLARELHNQGPITPDAIEAIIRRLAEDPNNIFSLALERLERRGDWHEVIKPLLGVLLVEYEPLTPWQLRTILHLDHRQVQNGLQCLSGLVTHIEQRYALYHLKFQDFLRQDETRPDKPYIFAADEEAEYHARLVQWCERDQLSLIWEDTRDSKEQSRRMYARHHYISHLYAARYWDRLFEVLDEQSYGQAKERYDVGARSYVQDLKKGCLAATWDGWTDEQHLRYLPHLWRYTLLRCSIRSTADQYPLDLFKVMLVLGKEREVAGLIELITRADKKVQALLLLAQHLSQLPERKQEGAAIYLRSEEVAHSIEGTSEQVQALMAVTTTLTQAQQWTRAEEVACSIQDASRQAQALIALATALAHAQQWTRAEEVARSIQNAYERTQALIALATALAHAQQWEQAEEVARSIQNAYERTQALIALATALAHAQERESAKRVFSWAEKVARSIQDPSQQAQALMALATALAHAQERESAKRVFSRAEKVARSLWHADQRVIALIALATALVQAQQWKQAEEVIRSIQDADRARALMALATALVQAQQWKQAEKVIHSIEPAQWQAQALTALATALAHALERESAKRVFSQAEVIAQSLLDRFQQVQALTALATALAHAQQWKQAEEAACSIQDASQQAQALTALATALAHAQERESAKRVFSQAEVIAQSLLDRFQQVQTLTALATALAQVQEGESAKRVFSQAEEVIRSLRDAFQYAWVLIALATALAQAQQWEQAEEVARSLQNAYEQAQALIALATTLAHAQERENAKRVFSQAEEIAYSIEDATQYAWALMALATALAQAQQWKQAEEVARSIEDVSWQAQALIALATALAHAQERESAKRVFSQAEEVIRSIEEVFWQAEVLITLATALAHAQQWKQAEEVARSIESADQRARALMALATALAQAQQWKQAEEVARSLRDASQQAQALTALATALAHAQERESAKRIFSQAEEIARSLWHADQRYYSLIALATALVQAQQWKQAEEVIRSIQDADQRARALMALATALAQAQQWKQAEEMARSLRDASQQAQALTALATALTEQGYHSHLLSFVQRSWQLVETREEALRLFPLAFGLITNTPALGMELYEAFQWVNNFLSGS